MGDEAIDRPDGSRIVFEQFEHPEGIRLWYENPEHRVAQQRGRDDFYEWYRVRRCSVEEDWRVPAEA